MSADQAADGKAAFRCGAGVLRAEWLTVTNAAPTRFG